MSSNWRPVKITPAVFEEIKKDLQQTCLSDEFICKNYNIGLSTLRLVKMAKNYSQYIRLNQKRNDQRKEQAVFLDFRKTAQSLAANIQAEREARQYAESSLAIGSFSLGIGLMIGLWLISLFGV